MVRISSLILASSSAAAVVGSGYLGTHVDGASLSNQRTNSAYGGGGGTMRRTNVIVTMKERTDAVLQQFPSRKFTSRSQRITALRDGLQAHASSSQARVVDVLNQAGATSHAKSNSYWLTNQMYVKGATPDLIDKLRNLPNVLSVATEQVYPPISPVIETAATTTTTTVVQGGVNAIGAPKMWSLGRDGGGVTVGIIDTGVRYTHQDLRGNWRQSKGWFDPETSAALPYDATGHGTHVTGIIAGANGIGVAPGAQWIMCKGCRATGCFASDLLACFQFMLCPTNPDGSGADCTAAPQIVSNSWGGGQGLTTFDKSIMALRTAGIIPVVAAGNTGPNCGTTTSPGDNANVITVGAVNGTDFVASFSAKGPSANGLRKPDVMGPGSSIRSSCWTADNGYCSKSGTSMATPHVSGAIAIFLSARSGLTYDQIKNALQSTAVRSRATGYTCGATSDALLPNNQFGFGRIDVALAVGSLTTTTTTTAPTPAPTTAAPVTTTPAPTTARVTTTPAPTTTAPVTTTPAPTTAVPASTTTAPPPATLACAPLEEGVDYLSNDVGNALASSADQCCGICRATTGCRAFSWTSFNGGTCWLKSGKGATAVRAGTRSGELVASCSAIQENTDYSGADVGNALAAQAELCCSLCRARGDCKAFTWTNFNGGTCWMKSAVGAAAVNTGARSSSVL